jgi:hypothetical protein
MSFATNGRAQPSKACEMGFARLVGVAPIGRLWYKSAAPSRQTSESVSQIVRYGYAPDVTAPRGWSAATDQLTEREVNCVV